MKTVCIITLCVLLICLVGCEANDTIVLLPMKPTDDTVDEEIIYDFLVDEKDKHVQDIHTHLKNITPEDIESKCDIYRFDIDIGYGIEGETFLVYGGEVYQLGRSVGGHGITEFAYDNRDGRSVLYFIYSFGSGLHRSHIGAFNFDTETVLDYTGTEFIAKDITFYLSEDGKTLGVCDADISWIDRDAMEFKITKGESIYKDISELEFAPIDEG